MNSTRPPAHKLGANRNDPARKSRRAKNSSESCDIHEDRGTIQSKFAGAEATTPRVRVRPHVSTRRLRVQAGAPSITASGELLTEHSSGPELHVVHLRLFKDGVQHVCVAGTFNDWSAERTPLQQDGKGAWEIALSLPPGDYEYRFIADGEWIDDPLACRHEPNPYGSQNAVLHVHHS